jgi:hypothetical protein
MEPEISLPWSREPATVGAYCNLSQLNIYIAPRVFKSHFSTIPSTCGSTGWPLSMKFFAQQFVYISHPVCATVALIPLSVI